MALPGASGLLDEIGDQGEVSVADRGAPDDELHRLMTNLGGHDPPSLIEAFGRVGDDKPVCSICYTIKGFVAAVALQGQPRRTDDAGADGHVPDRDERPSGPRMGQV